MGKVDVEGAEWEVLQGAGPLLQQQRVGAVVLEYSHFWGNSPSLRAVAEYMTAHGYDGYFVGSRRLVPFSGPNMEWWDELLEVCASRHSQVYRGLAGWCWLNVAFLLRGSPAA